MELLKLYYALLRRRWLLVQAVVFFTVGGAVAALSLPKAYEATARVSVSSDDATSAVLSDLGLQEMAMGLSGASDDIANHIALATSRPVLEQVIQRLQLRDDEHAALKPDKLLIPGMFGELEAAPQVLVEQQQGTDLVRITATADDPELAQLMADTVARVYIAETQSRARQDTREAREFVDGRLEVVEAEFDRALGEIADVQQQEQVVDLESELRAAVSRLSELLLAAEENSARIREVRAQIGELRGLQATEVNGTIAPGTLTSNPDAKVLRELMLTLQVQRESLLLDKTERHPDVQRVDAQLKAADEALALVLEDQHALDPTLVKLRTELSGLLERGVELNDAIVRANEDLGSYPAKIRRLSQLELAATAAEEVYQSLQSQSYEIAIAEALAVSPLELVEPAALPDRHARPRVVVYTVLGMALGVLVGLGLVLLFETIDDSVRRPEDLAEVWDLPNLGIVPRAPQAAGGPAELPPTDPTVEAFRALRGALAFANIDGVARRWLITSCLPGEGKSTVTAHLALSMAREGRRVLVVDADLRRPTAHRYWPQANNSKGLVQVLLGELGWAQAVQETGVPGLHLLASGGAPVNPSQLVESARLKALLEELAGAGYDAVLVDAPPVLVVNDAAPLARAVDRALLVVESGSTGRRVLEDAKARLQAQGFLPMGTVLNKVDLQLSGYGAYQRAYRSYTAPPPGPAAGPPTGGAA